MDLFFVSSLPFKLQISLLMRVDVVSKSENEIKEFRKLYKNFVILH